MNEPQQLVIRVALRAGLTEQEAREVGFRVAQLVFQTDQKGIFFDAVAFWEGLV